jgi:hypothetical protein
MDEMLAILGDHDSSCLLFIQLFLERLPEDIRLGLSNDPNVDPRELAQAADKRWSNRDMHRITTVTASLSKPVSSSDSGPSTPLDAVISTKSDKSARRKLCYYHVRFGDRARKCLKPCAYTGNGIAGRQ